LQAQGNIDLVMRAARSGDFWDANDSTVTVRENKNGLVGLRTWYLLEIATIGLIVLTMSLLSPAGRVAACCKSDAGHILKQKAVWALDARPVVPRAGRMHAENASVLGVG
jgi:hypothetical protein